MATFMAWLTANAGALGIGAAVVAALWCVVNADKVKAFLDTLKNGQGIASLTDAIKQLPLVKNAKVAQNEVHNIIGYAEMKVASVRVLSVVDEADKAEVATAFETILTKVAKAKVTLPDQPAT